MNNNKIACFLFLKLIRFHGVEKSSLDTAKYLLLYFIKEKKVLKKKGLEWDEGE